MKLIARWAVAALVTVAAFAVAAWVAGSLVLPHIVEESVIRWSVATALGVVLASLAAMWGNSFATPERPAKIASVADPDVVPPAATQAGDTHNEISGGTFHREVTLGRDISISGADLSPVRRPVDISPAPGSEVVQSATTGAGNTRSAISGGTFHGNVTQGRDISRLGPGAAPPENPGAERR